MAQESEHCCYIQDTLTSADNMYARTKLDGYFSPKEKFRKAMQQVGENLDSYHTRLQILAKD